MCFAARRWEHVPKAQGFVSCTRHDRLPVRTHAQVEHPEGVPSERSDACHARVLPDYDLVERVTVCARQFVHVFREHQVAHLRTCVDTIHRLQSQRVPEADASVSSSTSSGKKAVLVGTPTDGLHGSIVLREFCKRVRTLCAPYEELVVVASRGELLVVERPFEPAYLLFVTL